MRHKVLGAGEFPVASHTVDCRHGHSEMGTDCLRRGARRRQNVVVTVVKGDVAEERRRIIMKAAIRNKAQAHVVAAVWPCLLSPSALSAVRAILKSNSARLELR